MKRSLLFRHLSPALALFLVAAAAFVVLNEKAAQAIDDPPAPAANTQPARHPLSRVVVLGGSLSAGFSARLTTQDAEGVRRSHSFDLAEVLNLMLVDPSRKAIDHTDAFFFKHPTRSSEMQAYQARKSQASVVIALDYLFWFAFADVKSSGDPKELLAARMASVDSGIKLLESISEDITLVVGDFPDMGPAVGGFTAMMRPERMPLPENLPTLNEQLIDWALIRGNVIIVPMAEFMANAHGGKSVNVGGAIWPPEWPLLQGDKMHATADGLVALNQMAASAMIESMDEVEATEFELRTNEIRMAMQAVLAATAPVVRQEPPVNPNLGRGTGGGG